VKVLVLSNAEEDLRSDFAFYERNQPGLKPRAVTFV
jgi:hypothetical protein